MCGIFGAIASNGGTIEPARVTCLALLNQQRGTDSTGFAAISGIGKLRLLKRVDDAATVVEMKAYRKFTRLMPKAAVVIGHCRFSTKGGNTKDNAHPFVYKGKRGRVVGTHNGMIDSPNSYAVDSMYLFDRLSKFKPQGALGKIDGNWGLAWHQEGTTYLHRQGAPLSIAVVPGGTVYYSSDKGHLRAACPDAEFVHELHELHVYEFDGRGTMIDRGAIKHSGETTSFARWRKNYDASQRTYGSAMAMSEARATTVARTTTRTINQSPVTKSQAKTLKASREDNRQKMLVDRGVVFDDEAIHRMAPESPIGEAPDDWCLAYEDYEQSTESHPLEGMLDDIDRELRSHNQVRKP